MTRGAFALAILLAAGSAGQAAAQTEPAKPGPSAAEHCRLAVAMDLPLVVLSHFSGSSVSTTWVGDAERGTESAEIFVEPGAPIQLAVTANHRTIYRLSGAVGRVRRLILMNDHGAGAVGIARERIDFAPGCFAQQTLWSDRTDLADQALRAVFGRPADAVGGTGRLWQARIGARVVAHDAPSVRRMVLDPETSQVYIFYPGGIQPIDPAAVVSDRPVGRFALLPSTAGVRELVRSGALIPATQDDARRWEAAARARGAARANAPWGASFGEYRATRPIDLPVGLCGSHSIDVYAPSPAWVRGNPCHTSLYFDDGTATGL